MSDFATINRYRYQSVPDSVISAKLGAEGLLRQAFPELAAVESPLTWFAKVVRATDITEVIRKLSDNGIKTISDLLEHSVDEVREFGLAEDELRMMIRALVLLWWHAYKEKLRADSLEEKRNTPACHSCSDWGIEVILRIDGRQVKLANAIEERGSGAIFDLTGKPEVGVFRIACSCGIGKEIHKRKQPIL